jgi:hypothetical protein
MIELLKQQQATWERLRWLEDGRAWARTGYPDCSMRSADRWAA